MSMIYKDLNHIFDKTIKHLKKLNQNLKNTNVDLLENKPIFTEKLTHLDKLFKEYKSHKLVRVGTLHTTNSITEFKFKLSENKSIRTFQIEPLNSRRDCLELYQINYLENSFNKSLGRLSNNSALVFRDLKRGKNTYWTSVKDFSNKQTLVPVEVEFLLRAKSIKQCLNLIDFIINQDSINLVYESNNGLNFFVSFIQSKTKFINLYEIIFLFYDLVRVCVNLKQKNIQLICLNLYHILVNLNDKNKLLGVKLYDLSQATHLTSGKLDKIFGRELFYPPEWFQKKSYFAEKSLVWSLGIILYFIHFNKLPYVNVNDSINRITLKNVDTDTDSLNSTRNDLIKKCLAKKPEERITLEDILKHDYLELIATNETRYDEYEFSNKLNKFNLLDGKHKNEKEVMAKMIQIKKFDQNSPIELKIIQNVKQCSNCIHLIEEIHLGRFDCFYAIFDKIKDNYIDIYDVDEIQKDVDIFRIYSNKIINAMLEMRDKKVYYFTPPNLKSNIFVNLNDNDLKIINFEQNVYLASNRRLKCNFMYNLGPPEKNLAEYDADYALVWYIGLQLYFLKFREEPFESTDLYCDDLKFKPHDLFLDYEDLVSRCLKKNLTNRISLNDLKKHKWFNKN